jgi:metallopeptidase MepB
LICSYNQSTPEKPGLLEHFDVRVLFHELGHAIHHLVERTKYATGQSSDFGEIPSNMLEHFVWIPEVMVRLSRHYTTLPSFQPGGGGQEPATIPLDLARGVARTKKLNQASGLLGLLTVAMFDLAIYTPRTHGEATSMDTTALWNEMRRRYLPYAAPEDKNVFGQAQFTGLFRGWDVACFKYIM